MEKKKVRFGEVLEKALGQVMSRFEGSDNVSFLPIASDILRDVNNRLESSEAENNRKYLEMIGGKKGRDRSGAAPTPPPKLTIPLFRLPDAVKLIRTLLLSGLFSGMTEMSIRSCNALTILISRSSLAALRPSLPPIAGALIRIAGEKSGENLRVAFLKGMETLFGTAGALCQSFDPAVVVGLYRMVTAEQESVRSGARGVFVRVVPFVIRPDLVVNHLRDIIINSLVGAGCVCLSSSSASSTSLITPSPASAPTPSSSSSSSGSSSTSFAMFAYSRTSPAEVALRVLTQLMHTNGGRISCGVKETLFSAVVTDSLQAVIAPPPNPPTNAFASSLFSSSGAAQASGHSSTLFTTTESFRGGVSECIGAYSLLLRGGELEMLLDSLLSREVPFITAVSTRKKPSLPPDYWSLITLHPDPFFFFFLSLSLSPIPTHSHIPPFHPQPTPPLPSCSTHTPVTLSGTAHSSGSGIRSLTTHPAPPPRSPVSSPSPPSSSPTPPPRLHPTLGWEGRVHPSTPHPHSPSHT